MVVSKHKSHGRNCRDDGHMYKGWKMGSGLCMQKDTKTGTAYLAMAVALAVDTLHLSALSQGCPAFLTMCRTAGFALKLNIAHDYTMPALQTDIDRDLNTLHHCLGAA